MRGASSGSRERERYHRCQNKQASAKATPSHMPLVHFASEASIVGGTWIAGASEAWR